MGLSSWISITGLFAELSLISYAVSEGFEIWSYITLLIQLANIGPCNTFIVLFFSIAEYVVNWFIPY